MKHELWRAGFRRKISVLTTRSSRRNGKIRVSFVAFGLFLLAALLSELWIPGDPTYMNLANTQMPPCREFWFGTDSMGRDVFSMVFYGGRISLCIGFLSSGISAVCALLIGGCSAFATPRIRHCLMRMTEIFLSVPQLLMLLFLQAILGRASVLSISIVIGVTGWESMAKTFCTEIRQICQSEFVCAARTMGGHFPYIFRKHLTPHLLSSIIFMILMQMRTAIATEATLSFLGLGLPLSVISWGSMLSMAQSAVLQGTWWMLVFPGAFILLTLICFTDLEEAVREHFGHSGRSL